MVGLHYLDFVVLMGTMLLGSSRVVDSLTDGLSIFFPKVIIDIC